MAKARPQPLNFGIAAVILLSLGAQAWAIPPDHRGPALIPLGGACGGFGWAGWAK